MSNDNGQSNERETCGASLEDHLADVILGLVQAGVGYGCPQAYHALVEVAEFFRLAGGHDAYTTPTVGERIWRETKDLDPKGIKVGDMLKVIGRYPAQQQMSAQDIFRMLNPDALTKH